MKKSTVKVTISELEKVARLLDTNTSQFNNTLQEFESCVDRLTEIERSYNSDQLIDSAQDSDSYPVGSDDLASNKILEQTAYLKGYLTEKTSTILEEVVEGRKQLAYVKGYLSQKGDSLSDDMVLVKDSMDELVENINTLSENIKDREEPTTSQQQSSTHTVSETTVIKDRVTESNTVIKEVKTSTMNMQTLLKELEKRTEAIENNIKTTEKVKQSDNTDLQNQLSEQKALLERNIKVKEADTLLRKNQFGVFMQALKKNWDYIPLILGGLIMTYQVIKQTWSDILDKFGVARDSIFRALNIGKYLHPTAPLQSRAFSLGSDVGLATGRWLGSNVKGGVDSIELNSAIDNLKYTDTTTPIISTSSSVNTSPNSSVVETPNSVPNKQSTPMFTQPQNQGDATSEIPSMSIPAFDAQKESTSQSQNAVAYNSSTQVKNYTQIVIKSDNYINIV